MFEVIRKWQREHLSDEVVVLIALLAVAALSIALLGSVLVPVFASLILAYLMQGWVQRLSDFKIPSTVSAAVFALLLLCVMIVMLIFILPLVWQQLGRLYTELPNMLAGLRGLLENALGAYGINVSAEQTRVWTVAVNEQLAQWGRQIVSGSVGTIVGLAQLAVYLVLVPLLVFFLLRDGHKIADAVRGLMRPGGMLINIWEEMDRQLANYVRGKAVEIIIVGLLSYGLFLYFGLNYTVLLSVLSGFSVLVPYVGAFAVTGLVALVSLIQWGATDSFYYVSLLYFLLQVLDGNVLVPLIYSDTVSLHPVSIVLAVLVFGGLWGIWGVFFAIPLATFVKAVYISWPTASMLHRRSHS